MDEPDEHELIHEVWIDYGDSGEELPSLIDAGPRGNAARAMLLGPAAVLKTTIKARCHFDAMRAYYRLMGWGEYTTDQSWDYQPYPADWVREQREYLMNRRRN